MSVWQYMAAIEGYSDAHTPQEENKLSSSEADDIAKWMGL